MERLCIPATWSTVQVLKLLLSAKEARDDKIACGVDSKVRQLHQTTAHTCPRGLFWPEDRSGGMYRRLFTPKRDAPRRKCVRQSSTCM